MHWMKSDFSPQASERLTSALTTLHLTLPVWAVSTGWSLALVSLS